MAAEHVLETLPVARVSQPMLLPIRWRPGHAQVEAGVMALGASKAAVAVPHLTIGYQRQPSLH